LWHTHQLSKVAHDLDRVVIKHTWHCISKATAAAAAAARQTAQVHEQRQKQATAVCQPRHLETAARAGYSDDICISAGAIITLLPLLGEAERMLHI
jgi:hypothetical protein